MTPFLKLHVMLGSHKNKASEEIIFKAKTKKPRIQPTINDVIKLKTSVVIKSNPNCVIDLSSSVLRTILNAAINLSSAVFGFPTESLNHQRDLLFDTTFKVVEICACLILTVTGFNVDDARSPHEQNKSRKWMSETVINQIRTVKWHGRVYWS